MNKCCNDQNIQEINGYKTCVSCGSCGTIVNNCIMSDESEFMQFDNSRCSVPISESEVNPYSDDLYTWIPKGSKNYIYVNGNKKYTDISTIHSNSNNNHKKNSYKVIEDVLDNLLTKNGYNKNIINKAKKTWVDVINTGKITRANPRLGLIACCVFYACNGTKTSDEICYDLNIERQSFNKGLKIFRTIFKNNLDEYSENRKDSNLFGQYISSLIEYKVIPLNNVSNEILILCNKYYEKIYDQISFLTPKSIIVGIIYYVCGSLYLPISKKIMIDLFKICMPTLNKSIKTVTDVIQK